MTTEQKERKDAFKVGFLRKVAELGMTPREFSGQLKQAFDGGLGLQLAGSLGKGMASGLGSAAGLGLKGLGIGAIGLPILAGGAAGAADAALNAPTSEDIDVLRKSEMLGLLNRLTAEVRQRQARKVQ